MKFKNICIKCKKNKTCKTPCAFVERMKEAAKGVCVDCPHYETCIAPCFLAESFINENSKAVFEKMGKSGDENITIVYTPNSRKFKNFTGYEQTGKEGETYNPVNEKSVDEVENFWNGLAYQGNSLHFCVFVDRFFNKMSYADLAIKYDTTELNISVYYMRAKTEVYEFLDNWNNQKRALGFKKIAQAHMKKLDKLPKRVQAFLLYHCFDLDYSDIGEIIGSTNDNTGIFIRLTGKDVKAGVNIIKFDEDLNPVPVNHMDKAKDRQKKTQGTLYN